MTKLAVRLLALTALLLFAPLVAAQAVDAGSQTLEGEFIWERKDENVAGPLKAVFEPTGEGTWKVAFHFTFDNESHVYQGTAQGSLTVGELTGEVIGDGEQQHHYTFSGTFDEDGSFAGIHHYMDGEEARKTGSLSFGRSNPQSM